MAVDFKNYMVGDDIATIDQLSAMKASPAMENQKVRIMPDAHAGRGCVVGTTATYSDKIVPFMVGVDIACRVSLFDIPFVDDFARLDSAIRSSVPCGLGIHRDEIDIDFRYDDLVCWSSFTDEARNRIRRSVGTLGGGNHMIEVDEAADGSHKLLVHCGSRYMGVACANFYQDIAVAAHGDEIDKDLCWLEGSDLDDYIHDNMMINAWSLASHIAIYREIGKLMGWDEDPEFITCIHNYVDCDDRMIRKGAISAKNGEKCIIPLNQRDGIIIGIGRGNDDWNYSAPHGAGRIMSRSKARKTLSVDECERAMDGIFTTSVNADTVDESPFCYKDAAAIMEAVCPTVDIIDRYLPVYNFKAN